ncbi:probable aspartate carbamoyltransferase, catalytic chain [Thermoplasma acidophilum]|uniref:Aspartate carbamoyltransferase catalytic subunit n=1 Tax=Thermoplasma acidophilum (strain ATCC 25905 / DSM 1728 / JCM 9062 / NBRC 15155 / AMRC-C165) TaxID=273075 RepID=PYRB_THEAC|nr:aspartate carbamoyltransferase [Thermoplasma acidophilum]Q9HKM2.1 RecName: Full=Aspartate carbamoyltransferase catalytic subunit; AltName: Full=Aspartate transcarbamylase; Short=ATCase [Thermoplasma acidophilum DSM 1728]CAC11715.1 probable aspartate carbamoyltransferase, catalytic chain [Thermoplasma acidophilum]
MLKNRSVVSIEDVDIDDLNDLFDLSDSMLKTIEKGGSTDLLRNRIMATLFYEPSTRTRLSFESAMHRLGGSVITVSDVKTSSVAKGETLADTIRMASSYSDIIVIRHPLEGAARLASKFANKPVINAGDGSGQHPTQTILDLYTIKRETGSIDGKTITMVGDLRYGRTIHSLIIALSRFDVRINLVSPQILKLPEYVLTKIGDRSRIMEYDDLSKVIEDTDVLYVTRIQKERFSDQNEYQSVIGSYSVDRDLVSRMKKDAIIMHPLPRIDEIKPEVDELPQARYFKQAYYGVPVRMALIYRILGD